MKVHKMALKFVPMLLLFLNSAPTSECFTATLWPRQKFEIPFSRSLKVMKPFRSQGRQFVSLPVVDNAFERPSENNNITNNRNVLGLYLEMCRLDNLPAAACFVLGGALVAKPNSYAFCAQQVLLVACVVVLITATSIPF